MNRGWTDFIKKLPGWITGLVAFVTAIVGFVKLWRGDTGLVTIVLLAVGAGGGMLGCAYLAFKRTPPLIPGGKGIKSRWHSYALAGLIAIPLLVAGGAGYHLYRQAQPPNKVIVLIADFDGPQPEQYRVTETVLGRLRAALKPYDDVRVVALGRAITEAEGSAAARAEGERCKAAVVIWGWYGVTEEVVPLSVHFELLRPPEAMPELGPTAQGQVQMLAVSGLESFTLQTRLSDEMAYLSLFSVGMARYAAQDWDGAVIRFSDALSQTAECVPALGQDAIYFYRGTAYYRKGDYDHAIADFDEAIRLWPDHAGTYNSRGAACGSKGDYDCAIADFDEAIRLEPDFAEAYYNRGTAYYYKGNYDRAITDFDEAIRLEPGFAEAYNSRGAAYDSRGDNDRAIADYDQAIRLESDFAEAYNNRGKAYVAKGDYDCAIADFDEAIRLWPDYAGIYYNRGLAYYYKCDYDRAIADFDEAIRLEPDFVEAYNNRGVAYGIEGDYDQAIADFDQAIQLRPDAAEAYYGRGLAYEQKGENEEAIADFERVLELSDDPKLRQSAQEDLEALGAR
jgi:tetratricopeptide (TPR) repeat protein